MNHVCWELLSFLNKSLYKIPTKISGQTVKPSKSKTRRSFAWVWLRYPLCATLIHLWLIGRSISVFKDSIFKIRDFQNSNLYLLNGIDLARNHPFFKAPNFFFLTFAKKKTKLLPPRHQGCCCLRSKQYLWWGHGDSYWKKWMDQEI